MWTSEFISRAATWLEEQRILADAEGYVVGISGGIDSAVAARLAVMGVGRQNVHAVYLPVGEKNVLPQKVATWLGTELEVIPLDQPYKVILDELGCRADKQVALGNLQARLRMASLYFIANELNMLVLGTGNHIELHLGYFTKYGDGGVDVLPLGSCLKGHVHDLAVDLGVPEEVVRAEPSAGLWKGQTDEQEIGVKYFGQNGLDAAVRGTWSYPYGPSVDTLTTVKKMHMRSEHKRHMPPIFEFDWEG